MDCERATTTASEETPLLRGFPEDDGAFKGHGVVFDFDPKGDSENPRDWPSSFKWAIVLLLACMAFTVYASPSSIPHSSSLPRPPLSEIRR